MPDIFEVRLELSRVPGCWHRPRRRCDYMCKTTFHCIESVTMYLHVVTTARSLNGVRHLRVLQYSVKSMSAKRRNREKLEGSEEDLVRTRKDLHETTHCEEGAPHLPPKTAIHLGKRDVSADIHGSYRCSKLSQLESTVTALFTRTGSFTFLTIRMEL